MMRPGRSGDDFQQRALSRVHEQSGRVPPQAADVERAILGAMLIEPGAFATTGAILPSNAFYVPKHRKIYEAIVSLDDRNQPLDLLTLTDELRRRGDLEGVGGYYLSELTLEVASAANVERYARIVAEKSLLRSLIETMTLRIGEAYDPGADAFDLLDRAESDIFQISESHMRRGPASLRGVLKSTLEHLETIHGQKRAVTGVPSGFGGLDRLTGGWQPSDLIIIAARPSMGKCLAHDARIALADGSTATIEEIVKRESAELFTLGADERFVTTEPSDFICDGLKPVFRVATRLGRRVDTTHTHPFLTRRGWTPLSALRPGQRVAVPRRLPVFGRDHMPASRVRALADSLVGETVTTSALPEDPGPQSVPQSVFTLEKPLIAVFLRRLFALSGHIRTDHTGLTRHFLCVGGDEAAREVQHLLTRFGILAQLHPSGVLLIAEERSVYTFAKEIGANGLECGSHDQTASEIYWDEIVSIDALGIKPVYDLTIAKTHNFVADDICVHNTALALACACNAALPPEGQRTPVVVFSLEMSAHQLAQRLLTSEARVNAQDARTGRLSQRAFSRLVRAAGHLDEAPIFIDDTPSLGILELRAKCRRLKKDAGIGLVFVDYLQLMHGTNTGNRNSNREQEIAQISRSLKALAKELNLPVIALSQLNRAVETRGGDKRPQLSDLRESGSIEQDADVVAFIYRAERYGITITQDDSQRSTEGLADIIISKQRNGPTGHAELAFIKKYARFENPTYREEHHYSQEPAVQEETPF